MKRKLTFTIRTEVLETFNMAIKSAGLRRDSYLNHVLPSEIDELLPLEPNSEKGEKQLRDMRRFLHKDFSKMNVALDEDVAEKLDQVCREKKIPRDMFIEDFMEFLSKSPKHLEWVAPLIKISELMSNPRFEYALDADEKTPYDWISVSDDDVNTDFEKARKLLQKALKKGEKS